MASDPTKLDDWEMLSLLARGLIPYMERVAAGEKDPFPYSDSLLRGFNQLLLTCALRDVSRAEGPRSIPEFVATWAILPLSEWSVKLDIPVDVFIAGDRLLDPYYDGSPTALCRKLSRREASADRTVNSKAKCLVISSSSFCDADKSGGRSHRTA